MKKLKSILKKILDAIKSTFGLTRGKTENPVQYPPNKTEPETPTTETPIIIPTDPPIVVDPLPELPVKNEPLPPVVETPPIKQPEPEKPTVKYLKDVVPFRFGSAFKGTILKPGDSRDKLVEVKDATCENEMKMSVHKSYGVFDFTEADAMISLFESYGIETHGHCAVWGSCPDWMRTYTGDYEAMLKMHVQTVVKHFKGRVKSWDIVNEAWVDGGKMTDNIWLQKIGADYVFKAYRWAREVDKDAKLFYNDVSIHYTNSKTQKVLDFAIAAKKEGILDGIGHQMHTSIGMDMGEWRRNLKRWVETGLLIHISEMDVEIGSNIMTPELAEKQSKTYQDVISITVTSVPPKQLWGIKTWGLLNGGWFKNAGKKRSEWKDLPLLFDEYGQRSQAYNDLLKKFSTN